MNDLRRISHSRLPVLLLLLLLFFCSGGSIQGSELEFINYRLGSEFRVNSNTIADDQQSPSIASFATSGDFIIVWTGIQTNKDSDVFFQRFYSNGTRRGTEEKVNTSMWNKNNDNPTIAVVETGGFFVAWDTNLVNLFTGYKPTGGTVRNDHRVSLNSSGNKRKTAVAGSLTNNRFLFVWETTIHDGDGYGIYASHWIDNGGVALMADIPVNTYTAGDQTNADICSLSDGGYVAVWQSAGQDGDGNGIYAKRFNEMAQEQGGEFRVNTRTAGNQISPAVAGLSSGGFVIVWQSNIHDGDGIFGQRYAASGVAQGSEFQVNTFTIDTQTNPDVASVSDGGFVVTWQSNKQDGDGLGIYAQRFDASGSKLGREFQVNTNTTGNQQFPVIAGLKDGNFVISWQSATGLYGQMFGGVWHPGSTLNQQPLTVYQGETIVLNNTLLSASDNMIDNNTLLFMVTNVEYCQFERVVQPGISITNFTQQEVIVGEIQLVPDGSFNAPTYQVSVNNGYLSTTPQEVTIYFIFTVESTLNQQPLTVYQGETIVLNSALLSASDNRVDNNTLLFMVTNVEYCQFERVVQPGISITNFTQQEVIAGEIQLVHDGSFNAPSHQVSVSNGYLRTTPQEATIYFILAVESTLNKQPLIVYQGETIVLNNTLLSASDNRVDNNTLLFMVTNVEYCQFTRVAQPGIAISNFTQQAVIAGEIQLVHDGGFHAPSYQVSVNNGYLSTTPQEATIYFIFTVEGTLNQQPLTVYQGETIVLNNTLLSASDNRVDNNTLLFMVTNVEYCQFERVTQPGIAITNFTQQAVIAGEIQLVHDGSINAPSYQVSVSNGYLSTTPQEATIYFSIVPWLVTIQLSIKPGKTVVLGSSHFQASYGDASPGELVYMVSQVQHGRFVLTSDLNIVITQFTQLQIDKGEIQFVHEGSRENPSFIAWVSNGPYQSSEYTVTVSFDLTTTENSVRKKGAIIGGVVGGVGGCLALSCCVAVTVALMGLYVVKNKKKKTVKKVDLEKGIEMVG